ncbi:MAG TPA: P1 family peptidase [Acetobacteraceae bacterium]|jgi:D-aminopeptidase|nr:P1 family peptidase [Acetobacteraceae bacterium]
MARARLRDLGIVTGSLPPGRWNAITDVPGVLVGYTTLIGDEPNVVRTGVTAIWPRGPELWHDAVFAGIHSFSGNGEMTGWAWIAEQGLLASPICITNTHSVGVVRDAVCALAVRDKVGMPWLLPVVAETYDGWLSDATSFPVTAEHAMAALDGAFSGPIAEGNVGGGAGMICHEFKGGTGTASRVVSAAGETFTVGALVQANYGARELLRVDGVPIGREIDTSIVPSHRGVPRDAGSIIVILATDAPLLPIQCQRLARRATTGLAWVGGIGFNGSGDIFLGFATGNHVRQNDAISAVRMLAPDSMNPLFQAAAEATEEAILNALTAAETMTGYAGHAAHALPLDRLIEVMGRYRR